MEITVKKIPVFAAPDIRITLKLTPKEATALATICAHIGGEPRGPRGIFTTILNELDKVGIGENQRCLCKDQYTGSIYLKSFSEFEVVSDRD